MSSPSPPHSDRTAGRDPPSDEQSTDRARLERILPQLAGTVRVASFWTAIVLPFMYVPLLATGLSTAAETTTFLGLLGVNLLALYAGHSHRA